MRYSSQKMFDGLDADALARAAEAWAEGGALEGAVRRAEVSLSFVSDDEMRELNARYRGIDEPTDVLSFPLWEEGGRFCPPDGWDDLPLGDVVIAPGFVRHEAEAGDRSFERDMVLMVMHGTLHLIGLDHADAEGEVLMTGAQERMREIYFEELKKK